MNFDLSKFFVNTYSMIKVSEMKFKDFKRSIQKVFEGLKIPKILRQQEKIILKPNLTTDIPYPITTGSQFVENLVEPIFSFY